MGAKKKKQRHIKPKAGAAKTTEEGSGDEGEDAPENVEAVAAGDAAPSDAPECPHLNSANPERIQEILRAGNALWCTDCLLSKAPKGGKKKKSAVPRKKKQQATPALDPDDVWICLTCGNPGCGRNTNGHAKEHQERSTKHALVMQQSTQRCWCYACDKELIIPGRTPNCPYEKVRAVAEIIRAGPGGEVGSKKKNRHTEEALDEPEPAAATASEPLVFTRDTPGLRGLKNLGNTCFFNSVMQNLVHNVVLRRAAVRLEPVANYGRLSVALLRFLAQMCRPGTDAGTFSPGNLFQEVIRKAPRFRGMQQQDSHELFHYLIDGVNDEELKRLKLTPKPLPVPDEEEEEEEEGEGEDAKEGEKPKDESAAKPTDAKAEAKAEAKVEANAETKAEVSAETKKEAKAEAKGETSAEVKAEAKTGSESSAPVAPTPATTETATAPIPAVVPSATPVEVKAKEVKAPEANKLVDSPAEAKAPTKPSAAPEVALVDLAAPASGAPTSATDAIKSAPATTDAPLIPAASVAAPAQTPSETQPTPTPHVTPASAPAPAPSAPAVAVSAPASDAPAAPKSEPAPVTLSPSSTDPAPATAPSLSPLTTATSDGAPPLPAHTEPIATPAAAAADASPAEPVPGSLDDALCLPHHLKGFPRTFIERVFGGITVSRVTCHTCRNSSDTVESSLDFSLPIQNEAVFALESETRTSGRKKKKVTAEKLARAQEFQALIEAATGDKKEASEKKADDTAATAAGDAAPKAESEVSFDVRKTDDAARILGGSLSVEQCLWRYTSPEVLAGEDAFGCIHCTRAAGQRITGRTSDLLKRRATKQVLIRRMPRLFVLHLKRFQQTARGLSKLGTTVRFGVTLDVSPFCEPGRAPPAPVYRLSGVVEHAGGLSSGHYTAYIRNGDKWVYFSDSHSHPVSESQVLGAEAYLLFYEEVTP